MYVRLSWQFSNTGLLNKLWKFWIQHVIYSHLFKLWAFSICHAGYKKKDLPSLNVQCQGTFYTLDQFRFLPRLQCYCQNVFCQILPKLASTAFVKSIICEVSCDKHVPKPLCCSVQFSTYLWQVDTSIQSSQEPCQLSLKKENHCPNFLSGSKRISVLLKFKSGHKYIIKQIHI